MFLEMTLWASLLDPLLGSEGRASAYQAEDGRFKSRRNSFFSSTCTKKCCFLYSDKPDKGGFRVWLP